MAAKESWTDESRKEILKLARPIVGQTSCRTVDDSMTSYHVPFFEAKMVHFSRNNMMER